MLEVGETFLKFRLLIAHLTMQVNRCFILHGLKNSLADIF